MTTKTPKEIIELLDSLPLSPYEFRLLLHFYATDNCNEPLRKVAKKCKISLAKVHGAKKMLVRAGLLSHWGVVEEPKDGFIYLLKSENGLYKIGQSIEPKKRALGINSASPVSIDVVHTFPVDNMNQAENELHSKFAEFRERGEWFSLSSDAVKYICSLRGFENGSFFSRIKPS